MSSDDEGGVERDELMREPERIMKENADVYAQKNKDYGASWWSIGEVLWVMAGRQPITLESPADIVLFGLHTRRMDKNFREFNGEFISDSLTYEGVEDSPSDESVYAAMAAAVNRFRSEGRLPDQRGSTDLEHFGLNLIDDESETDPEVVENDGGEVVYDREITRESIPEFDGCAPAAVHKDLIERIDSALYEEEIEDYTANTLLEWVGQGHYEEVRDVLANTDALDGVDDETETPDPPRVYLAGPVQHADDNGTQWRDYVTAHYDGQIEAVDPLSKYNTGVENVVLTTEDDYRAHDDEERTGFDGESVEYVAPSTIVEGDRDMIDSSDVLLVKWDDEVPMCGTPMEIMYAYENHPNMPIVVVTRDVEGDVDDLSPWLRYHADHFVEYFSDAIETIRTELGIEEWSTDE